MDAAAGMAILAGLSVGYVVGRLRVVLVPLAVFGVAAVVQQITAASRGHWTPSEAEVVGASFLAVFAALAGVGVRRLQARYYDRGDPPPFAPLATGPTERQPPDPPSGFEGEGFDEQDRITRRAWQRQSRGE